MTLNWPLIHICWLLTFCSKNIDWSVDDLLFKKKVSAGFFFISRGLRRLFKFSWRNKNWRDAIRGGSDFDEGSEAGVRSPLPSICLRRDERSLGKTRLIRLTFVALLLFRNSLMYYDDNLELKKRKFLHPNLFEVQYTARIFLPCLGRRTKVLTTPRHETFTAKLECVSED